MSFKIAQLRPPQPETMTPPVSQQDNAPAFNETAAIAYNTKSQSYFKNYADDIKRVLGTSADWTSKEFAQAVYEWQKNNGLTGKWIDGKFGPVTMGKMVKVDSTLAKKYDVYSPLKEKHMNERPYKKVVSLISDVNRIRNEMGATNIPLNMLMGWIQVESGGRLHNLTTSAGIREAGLFQISDAEAKAIGADQDRIMQDKEYAIRTGIQLAQHHAENLDRMLSKYPNVSRSFSKGSDLYWRMVMMCFSAGTGTVNQFLANMEANGEQPNSWDDVMRFAATHPGGYRHSPIKWSYHINRAFSLGNQMVSHGAIANVKVLKRIKEARRAARKLVLDDLF